MLIEFLSFLEKFHGVLGCFESRHLVKEFGFVCRCQVEFVCNEAAVRSSQYIQVVVAVVAGFDVQKSQLAVERLIFVKD